MEKIQKKFGRGVLIFFLVLGAIIILWLKWGDGIQPKEKRVITSSTLKETINISDLSTSKFTYNGIAVIYKDKEKNRVKCHIKYNATVKAGIDMSAVEFEVDDENKIVKAILPQIKITSNTVDEKSLSFIPQDAKVELKDALIACQNDALVESQESQELLSAARENLKSVIEALLLPVVSTKGYSIVWG